MKRKGDRNYCRIPEEELMPFGGIKTIISNNYYSEDEFWKVMNRENYCRVKRWTDPDNIYRDLCARTFQSLMGK